MRNHRQSSHQMFMHSNHIQKANECQKNLPMKDKAEKRCLTADIAPAKMQSLIWKRNSRASNEIRLEKKSAQQIPLVQ
eukprot:scaffold270240_cov56-Cyclotella_meneghiniana.AAC.2